MQSDPKAARAGLRIDTLAVVLDRKLESEGAIVDLLVGALAKGQPHPELWQLLHQAARRDERLAELAFVYERLTSDRRLKTLPPSGQAELLMHVASFFADDFGDPEGAIAQLQRVLATLPAHAGAFEKLESLLVALGDGLRLSELYAGTAAHRAGRDEQLRLLRRALELVDGFAGEEDRAFKLLQQILKIDPADVATRKALEERYLRAGRFSDVARMLEQTLLGDAGTGLPVIGAEELAVRGRLITLYTGELHETERALPHVEEVLRKEPAHDLARKAAEQLLRHKPAAVRAATALEGAYERLDKAAEAAQMLCVQVDHLRGPRRLEAQKRLASLLFNRLGDLQGAFALSEAIVIGDPADEEARQRYRTLAGSLDRRADAARILGRAAIAAKDPALRARIGSEVGDLLLEVGDTKKAKAALQAVVDAGGDEESVLRSARALVRLCTEPRDQRLLATALDRLSDLEPDASAKAVAAERLAKLCEAELRDPQGAVSAWRKLLGTQLEPQALAALETLYAATSAHLELAPILERRAAIESDPAVARSLAFRAAEIWSTKSPDRPIAIAAWRRFAKAHGPAREAHAMLMPLLEQERLWGELGKTLASEAALAPEKERVALLARLGHLRLARLEEAEGAIAAFREALAVDPADRASRVALEKLLSAGAHRLAAADVLEPVCRAERRSVSAEVGPGAPASARSAATAAAAGLLRVLDVRAALSPKGQQRLAALREAADLAERELKDPKRAVEIVARGLREAAETQRGELPAWFERIDRLASGIDASRRAAILADALGDQEVVSREIAELARRAGEALVLAGEAERALAVYRRALAFEPSSPELLSRVDTLLKEQGSPAERVALYRAALDEPCDRSRRRELLHAIGAIERRELHDLTAAISTYRCAVADDPDDHLAHEALLETYQAAGAYEPLYEELTRGLERAEGEEQKAIILRMAEVADVSGRPDRAAAHYREILRAEGTPLGDAVLEAIERIATEQDSPELLKDVFERRVLAATDPLDEAHWLERLGALQAERLDDDGAAVASWKRAATLVHAADIERAQRLYERVLGALPDDRGAAAELAGIYRRAEAWDRLPAVTAVLLRGTPDAEALELLIAFEPAAIRVRATKLFVTTADAILDRPSPRDGTAREASQTASPERLALLRSARARVLAADPERQDEAARAYKQMIVSAEGDPAPFVDSFEAFLAARKEDSDRHADRRWLHAWQLERAPESERVRVLLSWAAVEEAVMRDARAAADLYARVLTLEPEHDGALASHARLLLALGDLEGAALALGARRDRSEGAARVALDLELAELLLERLDRPAEAVASLAAVLDAAPGDAAALRLAEKALARPDAQKAAAELLERVADASEDPEQATAVLETLLVASSGAAELRGARRGWFDRLLDRREGHPELALDAALRAVRELPDEPELWDRLEEIGRDASRPDVVADAYRRCLDDAPSALLEGDGLELVGRRAVEYHEEWFEDAETVLRLLRRIVMLDARSAWALDRLKLAYNASERWDELFQLCDEVIASASDETAKALLLEDAAQTAKDLAGDADRAIRYLERLYAIRRDARTGAALERLYERHGRHRPLIDLLTQQLEACLEGEGAQRQRARIAAMWLDGARDPEAAFETISQILAVEPAREEAFDLLERLLALPAPPATTQSKGKQRTVGHARQRAAALLRERYRGAGRTGDVVRMLEVELEASSSGKDRARRLREIVRLRTELGDEVGALDSVAALVTLEPRVAEHRRELDRLAERTGRHERLAEVLAAVSEAQDDPKLRISIAREAAAIYSGRLGDRARAIELLTASMPLSLGDRSTETAIARDLDRLLCDEERLPERCDVLERLGELETGATERRDALRQAARIAWTVLGDADRAIASWSSLLEDDPGEREALDGMIDAMEDRTRWREVVALRERRAALAEGDVARSDLVANARALEERLGDLGGAVQAWRAVRERFGADDESCDALASLLERSLDHSALVALLDAERGAAASGVRRALLSRRLGDVHRTLTMDLGAAVAGYRAAMTHDPADLAARQGLEAIVDRLRTDGQRTELLRDAVGALRQACEATDDDARTIALLEPRIEAAETDGERALVLCETAKLLERQGSVREAFDSVWRALAFAPDQAIAADALRLAGAADRWADVAAALEGPLLSRSDMSPAVACALLRSVAIWHRDRREDPEAAQAALERALAHEPGSIEVLSALADLQRRSRGRPLVETLLRLSEATGGDLDLCREAVEIAVDQIRDRELAVRIAEGMLDLATKRWIGDAQTSDGAPISRRRPSAPDDLGLSVGTSVVESARWALDLLTRLRREEGDIGRVVELYLRGARLPFPPTEARAMRVAAAELAEVEQAIAIYRPLFDEDPSDRIVSDRLEALYRRSGRSSEMLTIRQRQIALSGSSEARIGLRLDVASLLAETGEVERAIAVLDQNLTETPAHPASVAKLAELYELRGQNGDLVLLWENQAERRRADGDLVAAAQLWARAAAIAETKLGDRGRALATHRRAADVGGLESLDALARLHVALNEPAEAAEALETLRARCAPERQGDVVLRLANAYIASGRPDLARERLEEALPGAADPAPLRARLATLYREVEAWGPLAELLAADAARAPDRATRLARLREAATLHLTKRGDAASAISLLEQATDLVPDDLEVRLALCDALGAAGRFDEATGALREMIAAYGARRPKDRALVHYELARVALASGDRPRALGELDVALRIDPAHPDILSALAELALEEGQLERAQRTYRALLLLVRRPGHESRRTGCAEVLLALADIAERQGEPERAAEYLDSAFEASRESAVERERLVRALRAGGKHETLARALEARLGSPIERDEAAAILHELAAVYDEHLGRQKDAIVARLRALSLAPGSASAHEAALELSRRAGLVSDYIAAVAQLVEDAREPADALALLLYLGRALENEEHDDRRAAEVYDRAEALASSTKDGEKLLAEIWRAMERVHERLNDADAQAAVLEKRAQAALDTSPPSDRADPLYRLAAIRLEQPGAQDQGASLLERAMAIDPQPDRAEAILRAAASTEGQSEPVLRLFERFARGSGRPRALVDALVLLAGATSDVSAANDALKEAYGAARGLGDRPLVESILRRVLTPRADVGGEAVSPARGGAWAMLALADLREAEGDLAEAASLKEQAAPEVDPERGRALLLDVARTAAGPLVDLERAARIYEELRKREPADRDLWEPLSDVYRRLGDGVRLAYLIEATVPLVDSLAERARLRLERATIVLERDADAATALLREILEEDPSQTAAAILLAGILEKAGRSDELADLLAKQLDSAKDREDVPSVISLSMRLGDLLEQRGDTGGALDVYRAVLDWDAKSRDALRAILRVIASREDPSELEDAYEKLLAVETGPEAALLAEQLARLRDAGGDEAGAQRALEVGFAACPTSTTLKEHLTQRYSMRAAWRKLSELHIAEAKMLDGDAKVEALCAAADVLRQRANEPAAAAEVLREALAAAPTDRDVLLALIDAYGATGQNDRATQAVTDALVHTPDDPWLHRSRAKLHETLGRDELALADIERAYDLGGETYASELVQQLERAVARESARGAAAPPRPRSIPPPLPGPRPPHPAPGSAGNAHKPGVVVDVRRDGGRGERDLRLRIADVLCRAGDLDGARTHLSDLVKKDPKDRAVLRALADLEDAASRWDASSAIYRRLLALEEGDALVETALRLADACERGERLGDARSGLERAFRVAPNHARVRERLRTVYNVTGASRELAALILEDANLAPDVDGRFALLLHAGRLLVESEDDSGMAIGVLEQAQSLRPEEQEVVVLLAEATAMAGRRAEARALLGRAIAAHKGRRAKPLAAVYRALSRIELGEGNLSEALECLVKAFDNDSHNSALAMELGLFAIDLDDHEVASRAFRTVTLMRSGAASSGEGTSAASKALAYYHLGNIARISGDRRKARLMVEKAVSEDPGLEVARALLEDLRSAPG